MAVAYGTVAVKRLGCSDTPWTPRCPSAVYRRAYMIAYFRMSGVHASRRELCLDSTSVGRSTDKIAVVRLSGTWSTMHLGTAASRNED
mmetsp:Transcript_4421/g.11226  ORF Transcript_4421/g.11226 Transcript_4421/m.11226 type:complete len:88 (-) Transcript_4421:437-700(-)